MKMMVMVALGFMAVVIDSGADEAAVNHVSKVFHDGAYLPHVYRETDVIRRYGTGDSSIDEAGLLQRRYQDPVEGFEVTITSNPDIEPEFRTVDEIRVSSIATGARASTVTEGLGDLKLAGIKMGDPAADALRAVRKYGRTRVTQARLGEFNVERACGYSGGGSSICFDVRDKRVVAMAVGFGP